MNQPSAYFYINNHFEKNPIITISREYGRGGRTCYERNTDLVWGDCRNYDRILGGGTLGIDGCVELMFSAVKQK